MRESRAWAYIKVNLPSWLAMERLEPMYPPGLPDTFWTVRSEAEVPKAVGWPRIGPRPALSGWLELKYCEGDDREYRAGRIPKLRPEQPLFLRRHAQNGVPGGILLRVGDYKWLLWKAAPTHEWAQDIRSIHAVQQAADVTLPDNDGVLRAQARLDFELLIGLLLK